MKTMIPRIVAGFSVSILLQACGGGDSGGSEPAPNDPGVTVSLTASPRKIVAGRSVTLRWSSTKATSCEADNGWAGARAVSGSEVIDPVDSSSTYVLRCSDGTRSAQATASVHVDPAPYPTLELTANTALARPNQTVRISWKATHVRNCYAEWAPVQRDRPLRGSESIRIGDGGTLRRFEMQCDAPNISIRRRLDLPIQTFAGELLVPLGILTDTDVNDPAATYDANDSLDATIPMFNFGLIPGYVNQPHSGPPGRSYENGDVADFFRLNTPLNEGQVIRLILPTVDMDAPPADRDDADLYLYDIDGNLVDASVGSGNVEAVELPAADAYIVAIKAVKGGMNYLLSIEDPATSLSLPAERLSADFVPEEALIALTPQSQFHRSKVQDGARAVARLNVARKAGPTDGIMRVGLASRISAAGFKQKIAASARKESSRAPDVRLQSKLATLLALKELRRTPGVRLAVLNRIFTVTSTRTNDSDFARQHWNLFAASIPQAWDTTTGSSAVTVAIVDSGVFPFHPDLQGKLIDGIDMVSNPDGLDGDGIDSDFGDPGFNLSGQWIYHGTHVAGIVGANSNNYEGIAGVSWGAKLMPIRAIDGRTGTLYDVLQSVRYAARLSNDSGQRPARAADVINLSLGSAGACDAAEEELFSRVTAAGIAIVAAAGNDSSGGPFSPAACPGVIGVGAINSLGERAYYSNFGTSVLVMAPGGDLTLDVDRNTEPEGIFSTGLHISGESIYQYLQGTSMAAPHVSGIYALMKSVRPTLTARNFADYLEAGELTDDTGARGRDDDGFGYINAAKAVFAAGGSIPDGPRPGLQPDRLNFGNNFYMLEFEITNAGTGPLTVTSVESQVDFATVSAVYVDADGLGIYRVSVARQGLPHGEHRGSIRVRTSASDRELPLVLTFLPYNHAPRAGHQHIKVSDAVTGEVVHVADFEASGERIPYRFDDVPPGRFVVEAGTDMNNDGDVCDPGELCGAFLSGDAPGEVDSSGTIEGVDIPIRPSALSVISASP